MTFATIRVNILTDIERRVLAPGGFETKRLK